jgi:glycerol-3-phosphate O-acyltransferase
VSELLGSPKEKESLFQLFSNVGLLNFKWGRIDVRFSKPFSLKKFIENQNLRRPERWDPMSSSDDFRFLLQSLSYKVLSQINAVTVIMPTALVGTILITLRGNGVGEEEVRNRYTKNM